MLNREGAEVGGKWRVLAAAVALWYACVVAMGAVGWGVGLLVPCDPAGFGCLAGPFWGVALGGLVGAVSAGVVAGLRWSVRWWWVPVGVMLVVSAFVVGGLSPVVAWTIALASPALSGVTALPGGRRKRPWRGLIALAVAAALVAVALFAVHRMDRAWDIAEVERVGVPIVAPLDRDDLRLTTVTTRVSGPSLIYILARGGGAGDSEYLNLTTSPGGGGCLATDLRPCEEMAGGVSVYRQSEGDHIVVFRDLGDATVRLSSDSWVEEQMVQVASELELVDAAWLIDRRDEE